mmetsp:Transcript_12030/g.16335  ORF Transcript_12030/g.16335 Transcript_12030/m.16335 type:complete len:151 (-) Transcript_12030:921-1373(-)
MLPITLTMVDCGQTSHLVIRVAVMVQVHFMARVEVLMATCYLEVIVAVAVYDSIAKVHIAAAVTILLLLTADGRLQESVNGVAVLPVEEGAAIVTVLFWPRKAVRVQMLMLAPIEAVALLRQALLGDFGAQRSVHVVLPLEIVFIFGLET